MAILKDLVKSEEPHWDDISNSVDKTIDYSAQFFNYTDLSIESKQLQSVFEHFEGKFANIFGTDISSIEKYKNYIDLIIRDLLNFLSSFSNIPQNINQKINYIENKINSPVNWAFKYINKYNLTNTFNQLLSLILKKIDEYCRKHNYYIPADQFSIRMYLLDRLLSVIMEKIIEESYKNNEWEISIDNTTTDIFWEDIINQKVNYNNDFILILNDPQILLTENHNPSDSFITTFKNIIIRAVREVPVPILVVGAANGDNKKNFPLLSFSGLGWHIEDVTFNANSTMSIQMKDLVVLDGTNGWYKYLHQYFEDFIKEFIISDFSDINSPMQGAFVDELSLSFTLLLFAPIPNNKIQVIKRIDFLFLPLAVELPKRDYGTTNISDFSVKGLSIFYRTGMPNKVEIDTTTQFPKKFSNLQESLSLENSYFPL